MQGSLQDLQVRIQMEAITDNYEAIMFFVAIGLSMVTVISIFQKASLRPLGFVCISATTLLLGVVIALRWSATGHPPILGSYEEVLSASFTLSLFTLIFYRRAEVARVTAALLLITLLYGLTFDPLRRPLVISEQSLWVYFHALFAWIAYGFYAVCFAFSFWILRRKTSDRLRRVAADPHGDNDARLLQTLLLYGFSAHTVMFILGSYYSSLLHGTWWDWDPVEYLFVASWLIYGTALHGRVLNGWKRERIAKWVVMGSVVTVLLYWALIYIPWTTYHVFDTQLKVHALFIQ